jgi:ABC-2 type transport system permease protein
VSKKYSQLNAMLAISKASFRSILRSPSAVVFTLAFPLIFILVFGFISGGGINLWVALDSTSDTKNPIFDSIATMKGIHLVPGLSDQDIQRDLQKGKFDAVL